MDLTDKFVVDERTVDSFAHQQKIIPDPFDETKRGVAVLYFRQLGVITPTMERVFVLKPYQNEDTYLLAQVDNTPVTKKEDLGKWVAALHRQNISGVYASIPVREKYQELITAWKQEKDLEPPQFLRARE